MAERNVHSHQTAGPGQGSSWRRPTILVHIVKQFVARESFFVRIVGYTDTDGTPEENRRIANQWAEWVKLALTDLDAAQPDDLRVWNLEDSLDIVAVGGANPEYDQATPLGRNLSNRVEFEVVEQIIPGEHGFRFFPAFYNNLFDTMRRTPILDADGQLSGTAFDKLVPTPHPKLGIGDGEAPKSFDFRRISSLEQIREGLRLFCETLGFKFRDLAGFEFYVTRYLMSRCGTADEGGRTDQPSGICRGKDAFGPFLRGRNPAFCSKRREFSPP